MILKFFRRSKPVPQDRFDMTTALIEHFKPGNRGKLARKHWTAQLEAIRDLQEVS